MKFLQKMKQKKADNKGFSLVELIIVIAIMAILVGIVGTQVVPYINKSKEAKDLQIISSYSTAAMTAYSANADVIPTSNIDITVVNGTYSTDVAKDTLQTEVRALTSSSLPSFESKTYETATDIKITLDFTNGKVIAQAINASGNVGEPVESALGM